MNQICRCCLADNPTFSYNIFHENLRTQLLLCVPSVNIEPDDGLPEIICNICWLRLREAIEFRRRCEENDRELRKRYQETSQAIDQALGLNILEQMAGVHDQPEVGNIAEPVSEAGVVGVAVADMGVVQLLEEYTNLEMTMLDELMLEDQCLADFQEVGSSSSHSLKNVEEDPVISELLAKFLNDPAIDSPTNSTNSLPATESFSIESKPPAIAPSYVTLTTPPTLAAENVVSPRKSTKSPAKSLHPCPQCEKKFTRNFQLKLHLISVHGVGDGLQYNCTECNKTFASRHSLNYHQKALHSMERPYICTHCERRFVLSTQLSSHLRTHTGEAKPRIFQCNECEKSWPTKSDLKTHMRSHDPQLERRYKCMRCPKSFFTQGHLNSHELVHTGEKPYRCALCEKAYQNIGNLNNHIFRSHGEVLMGKQLSPYSFGISATQCDA